MTLKIWLTANFFICFNLSFPRHPRSISQQLPVCAELPTATCGFSEVI